MPTLSDDKIKEAIETVDDFLTDGKKYYMLLCKEQAYYTLFSREEDALETFGEVVIDCLKFRGDIVAFEPNADGYIEFWVKELGEAYCYLLFNYDMGVVPFN